MIENHMAEAETKRLKILYAITKSNWGGAQRYVYDLATHFSTKYDVVVAAGGTGTLITRLAEKNIRTTSLSRTQRNISILKDFGTCWDLYRLFRKERPDIVHLNSSKIGGIGAVAGRLAGVKKIIFTGHGWAFNEDRGMVFKIGATLGHWATILLCHKTVAVSEKTKNQIEKIPGCRGRITTIHNGIEPIAFYSRKSARSELLRLYPELQEPAMRKPVLLGTIGELHRNKGHDLLTKALARIKHLPFLLVIISDGEERKSLEALVANLGLGDKIFFLGHVPDAAMYMKAFDIFLLTSRTEAFPYVLLEAGYAAAPTIASAVGGIPEVITQLETGILVKPENTKELSGALAFLIQNKQKRELLGKNLEKYVKEHFSRSAMLEKIEKLYLAKKTS